VLEHWELVVVVTTAFGLAFSRYQYRPHADSLSGSDGSHNHHGGWGCLCSLCRPSEDNQEPRAA
jgi:hypothetical protein